ncbi:MAG: hypothetical protein K5905_00615 [Roseibium sp.]|uniref:hypothetical protein n=1 Tax=Roseibium sp. TaxID=1936156 RepID=UPI0026328F8B|nr:hypothetical protein [Roseibium sp.]MCV0423950.1 hypothetical protein [Roseibium sp.]
MIENDKTGRALGPQEALFAELTRRGNGGIQLVTIARFEEAPKAGDVIRALKRIHQRHPMMRARIEDRDTLWWVCDVPFEEIEIRLEPIDENFDLEIFYAREAARVIDVAAVSWRATLVTDDQDRVVWIALVSNHAGIDGRSALVVLNDLDTILTAPEDWSGEPLPLTAPAEVGLAEAGYSGDRALLPVWPAETMWQVETPAASDQRKPHGFLRVVPRETIDAVHERLRAEDIHLASAFVAAAVEAARELPGRTDWTGIVAPTDVRADCAPPIAGNAVGEYVAGINLLVGNDLQETGLVEIARELQNQFTRNRPPSLQMDAGVPLPETVRQVDQMAAACDVFAGGICVTDVGDLNRLSGRRVGFSEVLMMPSQNHGIHPVLVAVVSTNAGTCLSFGFDEPLQTHANAAAFADRYIAALEALAGGV